MSGSPTVGNHELMELVAAGLVSPEACRSYLAEGRCGSRPKHLRRLCRKVLRNPANARILRQQAGALRISVG